MKSNVFAADPPRKRCWQRKCSPDHLHNACRASGEEAENLDECKDPEQQQNTRHQSVSRRGVLSGLSAGVLGAAGYGSGSRPAAASVVTGAADPLATISDRVSEFTLDNGLHFIVLERHNAPIFSSHTYANVGAFDEQDGQTGLAHLLEHMAFKGTRRIGTLDYRREAPLLDALDEAFYSLRQAQAEGSGRAVNRLAEQFVSLQRSAEELVVPNAYGARLQLEGGVGLNAATSQDNTKYYVSLPANKLELWFALESERFMAPVWRQLYSEKRVVAEERRLRIDNSPFGRFTEAFARAALTNKYSRPVIGWPEDVDGLGRLEVQDFFRRHYGPRSLTIALVGDVNPSQVQQLAERYFGGWRGATTAVPPSPVGTSEPLPRPLPGTDMHLEATAAAGPAVLQAYYRPSLGTRDALALDLIGDILSSSRTSRFYSGLVRAGLALSASAVSSYPGDKHPAMTLLFGVNSPTTSIPDMSTAMQQQACSLAEGITPRELERTKKASKMSLLESLSSNSSLAGTLCNYHALSGSWQNVVQDLDTLLAFTAQDLEEVAARTFSQDNCFTGYVLPSQRHA